MRNQGIEEIFVDVTQARIFIAQAKAAEAWQEYIDSLPQKNLEEDPDLSSFCYRKHFY